MFFLHPRDWTHHHTQRLYHTSMVAIWAFITLLSLWGGSLSWLNVKAGTVTDQIAVSIAAIVGSVNPGPTVEVGGGGGVSHPPKDLSELPLPPSPSAAGVTMSAANSSSTRIVVLPDGTKKEIPVFTTQFPGFNGATNIPNARIFLEIHSDLVIRGSSSTSSRGEWSWSSPEPVSPGLHQIKATSRHPSLPEMQAEVSQYFYIELLPGQDLLSPTQPLRLPGGGIVASAVDVVITVPLQYQTIKAGEPVNANVKFLRAERATKPSDIPVRYLVQDSNGEVVMNVEEFVSFVQELSLVKTFYTASNLPEGSYKISVTVPTESFIASSSDVFNAKNPVATVVGQATDYRLLLQIFIGLFVFFAMILYFEYRRLIFVHQQLKDHQLLSRG